MIIRLKALRSLRWNYTRKGVWFWLKGRHHVAEGKPRGFVLILREPQRVIDWQTAAAEGVFV
ncbi:MAG TPA: hypothetical protein VN609_11000 [Propionibacteriaceae bacterium]|nr:hypothetical protein [Propionibacteriaceae bacterium]